MINTLFKEKKHRNPKIKQNLKYIKAYTLQCAVVSKSPSLKNHRIRYQKQLKKNVSHGSTDSPAPRNRRREIRQFQAQIRNLLSGLHRSPSHRLLSFPSNTDLSNSHLFTSSFHHLRRHLWCPLHCPPYRHRRLCFQWYPHAHAP